MCAEDSKVNHDEKSRFRISKGKLACCVVLFVPVVFVAVQCGIWSLALFYIETSFDKAVIELKERCGIEIPADAKDGRAARRHARDARYLFMRFSTTTAHLAEMLKKSLPSEFKVDGLPQNWYGRSCLKSVEDEANGFGLEWMHLPRDAVAIAEVAVRSRPSHGTSDVHPCYVVAIRRADGLLDVRLFITFSLPERVRDDVSRWEGYFWGSDENADRTF